MTPLQELTAALVAPDRCSARETADAIDALIKERITQAFYEYEARRSARATGHYPPSPDELNIEHVRAGFARVWGDAT